MADVTGLCAKPAADQHILHAGKEYTTVKEGLAYILVPASAAKVPQTTPKGEAQPQSVFYNPIQQFNRDLSVLAIKAYGEGVVERKRQLAEKSKQNLLEKKRKREHPGNGQDTTRKAAKTGPNDIADTQVFKKRMEGSVRVTEQSAADIPMGSSAVAQDKSEAVAGNVAKENISEWDVVNAVQTEAQTNVEGSSSNGDKIAEDIKPKPRARFTILDALSATGLRALRYVQEIPFVTSVTANDLLPEAVKTINLNIHHNRLEDKIKAVTGNAMVHMYELVGEDCKDEKNRPRPSKKYDVIDLDPYGTASPFLDAAVQAVRDDGGLLCVTCTDAGVWASNGYPEKAYSLYGGVPIKGLHSHEGGLRLILHSIATSAARYGMAIEPMLSLSIDFYARVFVRIYKSPADVKFLAGKTMIVNSCDSGCGAWETQMVAKNKLAENKSGKGHFWKHQFSTPPAGGSTCKHCGMTTHMAGPMYGGLLHNKEFIKKILADLPEVSKDTYHTTSRIEGMLSVALEETLPPLEDFSNSPTASSKTRKYDPATLDHYPFFFLPSALSKVIHCVTPHENALRGALRHLGYRVVRSHTKAGSLKTDAPWEVIWEVMREWVRQKAPIREGAIKEKTAGWTIMGLDKPKSKATETEEDKEKSKDTEMIGGEETIGGEEKPKLKVVFDEKLGMEKDVKKLVRYQLNPRENWGPMNRARG